MRKNPKTKRQGSRLSGHPKYWLSGERARAFRRSLSLQSGGRDSGIVQSHKFPLVVEPPDENARTHLREEYRLSSAVEKNTLFHFFTAVHLAGFRVFPTPNDAGLYKMQKTLQQSKLNTQLKESFDLQGNPAHVLLRELAKDIRKTNQSTENVIRKLENIPQFKADEGTQLHQFVRELADEIADNKLWAANQKEQRWQAIVTAGKRLKLTFTIPTIEEYQYCVLWDRQAAKYAINADVTAQGLEFAMHQMVSLAASIVSHQQDKITENDIKAILLSDASSYNGINWLFGGGINLFAEDATELKSKGMDTGQCDPAQLESIRSIATTLRDSGYKFAKCRMLFGGNISSGISNYWGRLQELEQGLKSITTNSAPNIKQILTDYEKADEEHTGLTAEYEQAALSVDELTRLVEQLIKDKKDAQNALHRLMGGGDGIAGATEVQLIEAFNDHYEEAKGLLIQLAEKIRTKEKAKKGDYATAHKLFPTLDFLLPPSKKQKEEEAEVEDSARYLKRKINRYSGAHVFNQRQIESILSDDYSKLKTLQHTRAQHWQHIADNYPVDIIAARAEAERQRVESGNKNTEAEYNYTELACRNLLHRLAGTVARLGSRNALAAGMALFEQHGVFAVKKEGADFFLDGKGRLYISPFANYQHQPLTLGAAFNADMPAATQKFIQAFFDLTEKMQQDKTNADILRDAAIMEQTTYALRCSSVRKSVAAKHAAPDDSSELNLPVSIQQALQRDSITAGELGRVFNAYASEINGLCARLARTTIIAKSRLQHIGDKTLYYAPKARKDWGIPAHLYNANGEVKGDSTLARGWRILQTEPALFVNEQTEGSGAKIQAGKLPEAVNKLLPYKDEDDGAEMLRDCLRQIPHDWHYKTGEYRLLPLDESNFPRPLDEKGNIAGLLALEKKEIKAASDKDSNKYIRLSGTSCHKGWLDNMLLGKGSFGDSSLIIEEEYRQQYDKSRDAFTIEYDKTRLELAVVFNLSQSATAAAGELSMAKRFIAIDLGERGIGYAVYKTPDSNGAELQAPIKQGHVVLPILRRLIKRVDTYRRRQQPRQRFQSNLNTALQQMREAAIGELAGVIDGLMKRHAAFPVFESSVSGFESGGKMLKMVYGSILQRYTFSGTDAHKAKRKDHWRASREPTWKHPWLKRMDTNGKELSMFPGVVVFPSGTSQTCSHCQLNPLTLVENIPADAFPVRSDENGIITLPLPEGGSIQLYLYGGRETADSKKFNPLPAKKKVLRNHSFAKADELRKHLKDMLRHKPLAANSKDTSQSTYLSPFVQVQEKLSRLSDDDLKKHNCFRRNDLIFMHADINAAVNIGAKWWRKINTPAEKKKTAGKR